MSNCNYDCFNCVHEDCFNERLTKDDFDRQQEFEFEIKARNHSSEYKLMKAREYYWKNREKCLERSRKYYHEHKDKFREYDRVRRQTHPVSAEKRREYYEHWRDKKRNASDQF